MRKIGISAALNLPPENLRSWTGDEVCQPAHRLARTSARPHPLLMLRRRLDEVRIDLEGDDVEEWLQGQITCDVRDIDEPIRGLILTAKGRVVTSAWVLPPAFALSVPWDALDATLTRLNKLLVMEDVELEPSPLHLISYQGHGAVDALRRDLDAHGLDAPIHRVRRVADEGAEAWLEASAADLLFADAPESDASAWHDARILHGYPEMGHEITGEHLPQEIGMRQSVSFDKGCYVGQEPVIMLEHRGKPRRQLVRVHGSELEQGQELSLDGRSGGVLTSVHTDGTNALALATRRAAEAGQGMCGEQNVRLEVL